MTESKAAVPMAGVHEHVRWEIAKDKRLTEAYADSPPPPRDSPREQLLTDAIKAVTQDRNNSYGPPTQDFSRTAEMLNAMGFGWNGYGEVDGQIEPYHVALIMIVLKLSRLAWDSENEDSWLDIAGYASCGYECVLEDDE